MKTKQAYQSPAGHKVERPVRVGVFATVEAAERAVRGLLEAGFTKDHISVICSDEAKEKYFRDFEHDEPAGTFTPVTAAAGGLLGALAGGLLGVAGVVATGGVGIVVVGPLFAGAGAAFGTFVGAMMSRGMEHEVANYYDQAVRRGQILVAAESTPEEAPEKLERAEHVFEWAGAEPVPLPQG